MITINHDELMYLLQAVWNGHLRASTLQNFTRRFYLQQTPDERLFTWTRLRRLSHISSNEALNASQTHVLARYNPENRRMVTTLYQGEREEHDAYLLDGDYYIGYNLRLDGKYITEVAEPEAHVHQ
jgi:hypothetical protein